MSFNKRILTAVFLLFAVVHAGAQKLDDKSYRQLGEFPFVIVSENSVTGAPAISDSLFDAAAQGIRFRVNSTQLQASDPFVSLYKEVLVPWLKANDMELREVFVRGAASPEGPYLNNVRLSRGRTARLIELLRSQLGQSMDGASDVNVQSITEDYGLLVKMMYQAADADAARVEGIWQRCQGDEQECKRLLKALDKGKVWPRLVKEYFPALRQARVILWFARKADAAPRITPIRPQVEKRLLSLPQQRLQYLPAAPVSLPAEAPAPAYTRRHLIAARTNLVHDLLYVPQFGFAPGGNIQLEYYPLRGHYTLNAGFTFTNHRRWQQHKFFQIRDFQLEARRYFKGNGQFTGLYLGAYAQGVVYGIGFGKDQGWEGEGAGGGISVGYTWKLNRKGSLRLEVSAALGVLYTRYDPYVYGNPYTGTDTGLYYYDYLGNAADFVKRNHQLTWLGPTNAGVHITYDIIYRKKQGARK